MFARPGTDGPIIHHRNSIAGSTMPNTVVRARRAGSLAMVEDGPFFSNTKQFYSLYNMNQTQSYKLRVMARIDRGFFTANKIWTCYRRNYFQVSTAFSVLGLDHSHEPEIPCLIELKDPAPGFEGHPHGDFSLDGLRLSDGNGSPVSAPGVAPATATATSSRLAVVSGFSITITSKIASTDKKIDLIQHTPKRDKGPQIVPGLRPIRGGGTLTVAGTNPNQTVVTFERVQFKTATANNGKRRAAQQFYILMVDLYAHTEDGQVFMVASSQSDSLVVRGRSPGHYVDTPERDLVTSPGPHSERRMSIGQHSSSHHPYHGYSGVHSRSHSISAGAGMSLDVTSLGLDGPLSPLSPGAASEYSPTAGGANGGQSFYQYPNHPHQAWTDGSSLSSPASTYEGSSFSSPTTAYPAFHQYNGGNSQQQHSPQEQASHQSYFGQRQSSFGSVAPRLMIGPNGVSPRHPFDSQLEPPLENSYEGESGANGYYQGGSNGSPTNHPTTVAAASTTAVQHPGMQSAGGYSVYSGRASHAQPPMPIAVTAATMATNIPGFVKSEAQDAYYFQATPSSTTASSVSSSFSYHPVQELATGNTTGATTTTTTTSTDSHGSLQENGIYDYNNQRSSAAAAAAAAAGVGAGMVAATIPQYVHQGGMTGVPLYQHAQEHKALAWS
ncbi:meiosis-specific transcription factor ndt80 [Mortierella sp. GBA43]|nr:meiosis-specific transcription factor ndt80 [Mortierella sp. GBA43]